MITSFLQQQQQQQQQDVLFCSAQQFHCLIWEVSLDLNAYRIVLCMIAVQSGVLGLYILVLPSLHEGCIQQWSGNGKCIFRNKIEKFCCNFNFY